MAAEPVTITRMKDGRHAVMGADGAVMGLHNSVFSAARQLHEYFGGAGGNSGPQSMGADNADPAAKAAQAGTESTLKKPEIPRPSKDRPSIPKPGIPRPEK